MSKDKKWKKKTHTHTHTNNSIITFIPTIKLLLWIT